MMRRNVFALLAEHNFFLYLDSCTYSSYGALEASDRQSVRQTFQQGEQSVFILIGQNQRLIFFQHAMYINTH